jgi:amino acid transporter
VDYALAAMILAAASVTNPDYVPENYQVFLLAVFIMIIHACISSMPTLWIARYNSYGSTFNLIALVIVVIIIPTSVTSDPKFTPSSVVWQIQNGTDWPDGIAVLMSFLAIIWTMSVSIKYPVNKNVIDANKYRVMMHHSIFLRNAPMRPLLHQELLY